MFTEKKMWKIEKGSIVIRERALLQLGFFSLWKYSFWIEMYILLYILHMHIWHKQSLITFNTPSINQLAAFL